KPRARFASDRSRTGAVRYLRAYRFTPSRASAGSRSEKINPNHHRCRRHSNEARPVPDGAMAVHLGAPRGIQSLGERCGASPTAGAGPGGVGHRSVPESSARVLARERHAGAPFPVCLAVSRDHAGSRPGHERCLRGLSAGPLAARPAGGRVPAPAPDLPGLRIGWVIGPPETISTLWAFHDYTTLTPTYLSDRLAQIALSPGRREEILGRTRSILQRNYGLLSEWIAGHGPLFTHIPPVAGAICFLRYGLPINSSDLAWRLLK